MSDTGDKADIAAIMQMLPPRASLGPIYTAPPSLRERGRIDLVGPAVPENG
jgi:hypothetical protein